MDSYPSLLVLANVEGSDSRYVILVNISHFCSLHYRTEQNI